MSTMNVYSKKQLKEVINNVIGITVPVVSSPAGLGKTVMMEELAKEMGYEIFIPKRMSGITDEIFVGIPEKVGDHFEFLKMGFIQKIVENPEKKTLLFLDEINRTPERLRPILFSLLERIIEDKMYPNLHIICAVNLGDSYSLNWEMGEDKALLSRMMIIEYKPDRESFFEYLDKNNYNRFLVDALGRLAKLYDYDTSNDELEQSTNYRTWAKIDHIFKKTNVTDIESASKQFHIYGGCLMTLASYAELQNVFQQMIRLNKAINILEVIQKGKMPKDNQFEISLAIKDFALNSANKHIVMENLANVMNLLATQKDNLIDFMQAAKRLEIFDKASLSKAISLLTPEAKKVLQKIL